MTTKREPAPSGALPNLIVIGAQKCGTTSLHNYLDAHPEIAMSRWKETDFFLPENGNWDRGLAWYVSQFDPRAKVRGETSTGYTNLPASAGTADRIRSVVPGAKLIYLVREPLDRMVSHYLHRRALDLERRPLAEALSDERSPYVTRSCYATQLRPFLDLFPRDQITVETSERLLAERQATLRRIFAFLEVESSFTSAEFDRTWERSEGKAGLYSITWRLAQRTRERGLFLPRLLRWPAQRVLRARAGNRAVERPVIDEELRERLQETLRPEIQELRRLTGLDLEGWDARSLSV